MTLKELRAQIRAERRHVGRKPYSHNIITLCLRDIARKFGTAEANKAIRDLKLKSLGYEEENEPLRP